MLAHDAQAHDPGNELGRLGFLDEDHVELKLSNFADMLETIDDEASEYFQIDKYLSGEHSLPLTAESAEDDVHLAHLRERAITNLIPLAIEAPVNVMRIEGYYRGTDINGDTDTDMDVRAFPPEMREWLRNRGDYKFQIALRASRRYGPAYWLVEVEGPKRARVSVLPTKRTTAFFADPVNDLRPKICMTIDSRPSITRDGKTEIPGHARAWDDTNLYALTFDNKGEFAIVDEVPHGLSGCPVVRMPCEIDDDGKVRGIVEQLYSAADRVNQAAYNSLTIGDYGAFRVLYGTGIDVGVKKDADGNTILDESGNPIPSDMPISFKRIMATPNDEAKFGAIDETDIRPSILHEEQAIKNFAIQANLPPHALLTPSMSNLGVEALNSVEAAFWRSVSSWQVLVGEVLEDLFRLIAEAIGDKAGAESYGGEIRWADMREKSFAQVADGLSKAVSLMGAPQRWAWKNLPGVSSGELEQMIELKSQEVETERDAFTADAELGRSNLSTTREVTELPRGGQMSAQGFPEAIY